MQADSKSPTRIRDLCLVVLFMGLLLTPAVAFALRRGDAPVILVENRSAAEFPAPPHNAQDLAEWPRAFESWHDDHFGLRGTLVRAHNELKIYGLNTSPSPRIAVGRDHWIFTTGVDLDLWRGADPFTPLELDAWRKCLESRQRELAKRGIAYYFVLAPSKAAVYPEFLPEKYRQGGPSRTDQLVAYLEQHSDFRIVDLRAALQAEKHKDFGDDYTYFPLGTHWNERGVLAGMRAIVAELARRWPEVGRLDDSAAGQVLSDDLGDSWAGRLYLPDRLTQSVRKVILSEPAPAAMTVTKLKSKRTIIVDGAGDDLPRAVVLHDSFGEPMAESLGRHFSHSIWIWEPGIDVALLESEKPDCLIQIFNDRVLATLQPQEFDAAGSERALERFASSGDVVLKFDATANSPRIQPFGAASVSLRSEAGTTRVACKMDSAADAFLLPTFETRPGSHAIVRLEFESPIASSAAVLFQTRAQRGYSRRRLLPFDIHAGLNTLYVELLEPELSGQLMFRPASEPGTFLISALEVRLVAD